MLGLPAPNQNDLAARINDSAFRAKVGVGIAQKLNLIRRVSNTAAHEGRPIQPATALQVLRELFHVVVFAAFRYSTDPASVPTGKQFDPSLAATLAPLSRSELAAAKDAEIAALKAQIAAPTSCGTSTAAPCRAARHDLRHAAELSNIALRCRHARIQGSQ